MPLSFGPRASRLLSVLVFPVVLACAALSAGLALLSGAGVEGVAVPASVLAVSVLSTLVGAHLSHKRGYLHSDGALASSLVAAIAGVTLGVGAIALVGFTSGLGGVVRFVESARDALHPFRPWPFG